MLTLAQLQSLREYDTALLANTLGYIDPSPLHEMYLGGSIQSQTPELGPIVGLAATCKFDSSSPGSKGHGDPFYDQLQRMSEMELPTVWVVETVGSRPDHECVTGDGMAKLLHAAGCQGVITNGYCRDVAGCMTVPFSVHCRGTIAHHMPVNIVETDTPIEVGGVTIRPGDLIHADREGVIRIPSGPVDSLIARAPAMRAFEQDVHAQLRRSDLSAAAKRTVVEELLGRYGFADTTDGCLKGNSR